MVVVPRGVEDLVQDLGFARIVSLEWWNPTELAGLIARLHVMRSRFNRVRGRVEAGRAASRSYPDYGDASTALGRTDVQRHASRIRRVT